jgi:uncharacterized protein YcbX
MQLARVWRYPVKSLAGEELGRTTIRPDGIDGDRVVRIVGPTGRRITARQFPGLLALHGTPAPTASRSSTTFPGAQPTHSQPYARHRRPTSS